MKILNNIKQDLPGLLDYIIFYNTGIVFQSTCPEKANVPAICANLNEIIKIFKQSLSCYDNTSNEYQKIIFETQKYITIILKLGKNSNLALFFDKEVVDEVNIRPIQENLSKLEELIDMDKGDLDPSSS